MFHLQMSLSLRDSIDQWNKGTNRWLRSIVYERSGRNKIIFTYALSALWHGFYPGYYLTFAAGAIFTMASRAVRRNIRPYFLDSARLKFFYDALTFITTRVIMAYITFSFILLELIPSINVYLYLYLLPHILAVTAVFLLPHLPKKAQKTSSEGSSNPQEISNGNARKAM